ncbi:MAG: site-specific DNA-methyltransferase [Acidobacteriota bacterium]|nr:site-specific DNA-methyltransferase [Acidobacteriota bacterium]
MKKMKLELTWIGKDARPRLEPRILLEDAKVSYHAARRVSEGDEFDNRVIFGDNLLALKALEAEFTGKVKCIYIDPPYNTGSAFTHYDDGLEHSLWLTMMRDRLEMLRRLLAVDGSIFVQIDDNEQAYLKVLMDETFGRANYIETVVWKKRSGAPNDKKIGAVHEYVLIYARSNDKVALQPKVRSEEQIARYKNPDSHPKGVWVSGDLMANVKGGRFVKSLHFPITNPNTGEQHLPGQNGNWRFNKEKIEKLLANDEIHFGKDGNGRPKLKRFLADVKEGTPFDTWWDDVPLGMQGSREIEKLFGDVNSFETVKPEALIGRVLELATQPGDLVLDSFAGSGTTGAVAHKMRRRFILVELGEHCHTHIIPRLRKVVDGADAGGVTSAVNWQGGGGFRYFRLAPTLLVRDKYGNLVINREYNAEMVASAMCKHQGFTYAPSDTVYWQHGQSSETDFIYVTTQSLTHDQLVALSEEVGDNRTLLICAAAFRALADEFPNLTLKKIPNSVLHKCEWGKDDYSLQIAELPAAELDTETPLASTNDTNKTGGARRKRERGRFTADAAPLFAGNGENELKDEIAER